MLDKLYKSLIIKTEDIPLMYSTVRRDVVVDIEKLAKLLVRRLQVTEPVVNEIITKIFNATGDTLFTINDVSKAGNILVELSRILKMNARPYIINEKFQEGNHPFINFSEFYDLSDIEANYTFASWMNVEGGRGYFDLRIVFDKLIAKGLVEKDEVSALAQQVLEAVKKDPKWSLVTMAPTVKDYSANVSKIAKKYIDALIVERWFMMYYNNLLDDISESYIELVDDVYDFTDDEKIQKVTTLMTVMGYNRPNGDDDIDNISAIMSKIFSHMEDNLSSMNPLFIDLHMLNGLMHNHLLNNIHVDEFDVQYCNVLEYSQLEIELMMLDVAVSIINPEHIINTVMNEVGCDREFVYDDINEFVELLTKDIGKLIGEMRHKPYYILNRVSTKITNKILELKAYYAIKNPKPVESSVKTINTSDNVGKVELARTERAPGTSGIID